MSPDILKEEFVSTAAELAKTSYPEYSCGSTGERGKRKSVFKQPYCCCNSSILAFRSNYSGKKEMERSKLRIPAEGVIQMKQVNTPMQNPTSRANPSLRPSIRCKFLATTTSYLIFDDSAALRFDALREEHQVYLRGTERH